MRRLLLSAGLWAAICHWACGQTPAAGRDAGPAPPQIPFGQTYKDFQFPLYQNGALSATLSAISATGVTLNRADTTELKIDLYTDGKVTTTITSPRADLYVADRVMRTKNTVKVNRADLIATSQACNFDLITKKYSMRQNVHVLLKNFDVGVSNKTTAQPSAPVPPPMPEDDTAPIAPLPTPAPPLRPGELAPDTPGASALTTNAMPIQPGAPTTP